MKIKQVEELVGITSKNIRFYEDQGLLNPQRAENGYREYHKEDIECLKKIKLLRKLGVSIEDIKAVLLEGKELESILDSNLSALEKEKINIQNRQDLTSSMIEKGFSIDSVDCDFWLDSIETMEKEGVDFVDVSKVDRHKKKKAGAFVGGLVVIVIMLLAIVLVIALSIMDKNTPLLFTSIFTVINSITIVGIIVSMRNRMKEIDGGEEDEALKY